LPKEGTVLERSFVDDEPVNDPMQKKGHIPAQARNTEIHATPEAKSPSLSKQRKPLGPTKCSSRLGDCKKKKTAK